MRKVVPFMLLLVVAACGGATHWEKAGVSDAVTATDMTECRRAASQESFLYFPYAYAPPLWGYSRWSWLYWQQRLDSERFYTEIRLTAFCMRSRGYELVPIPKAQG